MDIGLESVTTADHWKVWRLHPHEEYGECLAILADREDAGMFWEVLNGCTEATNYTDQPSTYFVTPSTVTEIKLTFVEAGEDVE